ncbi:DNA cytosine methyltransferase [Candidatus Gracilibacteria bacterium]|nr:DNA cytosine methyltransferase [Candidatus Gracilibacteria bacterium]
MNKIKVGSMFAGIGGVCLGFKNAGFDIVWANEIDKNACITYRENFGENYLYEGDIRTINGENIPNFEILTAGFPCQAFSIAGYQKGFEDERGNLFFEVLRIIREKEKIGQKPEIIFLENVKNLVSHDKGNTFKVILEALESYGFYLKYKILNTMEYGNIPQNRERIYIVGFLDNKKYNNFKFPEKIELTKNIRDIISKDKQNNKYYYDNSKYFSILKESMTNKNTVYQWRRVYVRENKNNVCPTLTANMGTGGHNVPLVIDDYGIRKLTPLETFKFQGFPDNFKLPQIADSHLYKQAGNSVSVTVITKIAEQIYKTFSNKKEINSEYKFTLF